METKMYILLQLCDALTKEQFKQNSQIQTYFGSVKTIIQKSWPQKNNWSVNPIIMFYHWSYILTKNITCSIFINCAMVINSS